MFEVGSTRSEQQSYSEPNPLRQIDVLTKGTLDHKNGGCAGVCPWRTKGQDDKSEGGRRQAVLDGDACTSRRERQNPHPPRNQTQTPGLFKEGDKPVRVGVAVVVPHKQDEASKTVGSTRVHKTTAVPAC